MDATFDYANWSDAELARAETAAQEFLTQHHHEISRVFARQKVLLDRLLAMLQVPGLSLEERLDCFARIAEAGETLRESANGFFELGAQPLVARTVEVGSLY